MDQLKTDILVIGAGPGGYTAAFEAAKEKLSVVLVDTEHQMGGTCLLKGCIPSKSLLHIAKLLTEVKDAQSIGIDFGSPKIDLNQVRKWKDSVIDKLGNGLRMLTKKHGIQLVQGKASFADSNSALIEKAGGTKQKIAFTHAIIAAGSQPLSLGFSTDQSRVMNSTAALNIEDVPQKLLVVGGGYIGLELGTVYAALGSQITLVEAASSLLPGVDKDLVNILQRRLKDTFEDIKLNTKVTGLQGSSATLEDKNGNTSQEEFDKLLVCIGRKPCSDDLGLENTNVKLDQKGFIQIDSMNQTKDKNIYAIGDIAGSPMLAHKAVPEGRNAVKAIKKQEALLQSPVIPYVVFTDPEIAFCGLTEAQAKEKGKDIKVSKFHWIASGRAMTLNRTDGFTKLIIDPKTDRILGIAIVGVGAGELISEGVLAVEMGTTTEKLKACIHPHPTLSETIIDAAKHS